MTDAKPTPLTDQALLRLRKLAEGNGLAPEAIELTATEEKTYDIEGTLTLTPKTDVQQGRYPGGPQGKGRQIVSSVAALKTEIERYKQKFTQGRDWIPQALDELKAAGGHGWGLDGAHVTMPERTVILAASDGCPVCHGQKLITCPQCGGPGLITCNICHGTRQERCYVCGGTGYNPQNPNQPCVQCQGRRFLPCRHCQGRGQTTCPTCQGRGGTACPNCKGTGQITEETAITFSSETHFAMKAQGLPSGLRRGLDRLGIVNLPKGYADIEIVQPKTDDGTPQETPRPQTAEGEKPQDNAPPTLNYIAKLPYADIKVKFGNSRIAAISVFGKRASLMGVPPFLDEVLKPARAMLQQGATDGAAFEGAIKARAIREAMELELGGKGMKEFRRLYPVGLSREAASEILAGLRQTMNILTLRLRTMAAIACGGASAGIFALLFITDIHAAMTATLPAGITCLFDFFLLAAVLGLNILAMGAAGRAALKQRFPHLKIALRARMDHIEYGLIAAVIVIYIAILLLAPVQPVWLQIILSHL